MTQTQPPVVTIDPSGGLVQGITPLPSGAGAQQEQPIGVPPGFTPQTAFVPGPHGPIPAAQIGNQFAQLNVSKAGQQQLYSDSDVYVMANQPYAKVKQVQDQMVAAGLLDPHSFTPGVWDNESAKAFTSVLAVSNGYGAVWRDTLDALVTNAPDTVKQGQSRGVQQTMNPLDIQAAYDTAATNLTGGGLPAGESKGFLQWYQQQEAEARDRYNKVDLTKGGTYTAAPGIDAAAQEYIKQHNLDQVIAYGTASRMFQFQQLLGSLP